MRASEPRGIAYIRGLGGLIRRSSIQAAILFFLVFVLYASFGASTLFPDPDTFYHVAIADRLAHGEVLHDFSWQQFTVLKDYWVDQHFLWHLLLIPFTWSPYPFGIKLAVAISAALVVVFFFLLLRRWRAPAPWLFAVILALTTPWTFRINLVKANAISLIFLFLGLWVVTRKPFGNRQQLMLFGIAFFYVWAYGGFVLLPFIVGLWWAFDALGETLRGRHPVHRFWPWLWSVLRHGGRALIHRERLLPLVTVLGGSVAGMVINPYFPKNVWYWWQQFVQIGVINYREIIGVGGEWYPYPLMDLTAGSIIAAFVILLAIGVFVRTLRQQTALSWTLAVVAGFFLAWNLQSRRYVEYSIPFLLLFAAVALRDSGVAQVMRASSRDIWRWLTAHLGRLLFVGGCLFVVATLGLAIIVSDQRAVSRDLRSGLDARKFQASSQWLADHAQYGDVVVHSDWDEWPLLFLWNQESRYIVGLDPTFMYQYDRSVYWQWVNLTIGHTSNDLASLVGRTLRASWVFLENDHPALKRNLDRDPAFEMVYRDDEATIYQLTGE